MSARAMDPLRPRRPGGMGRGAAIAIGVHVLLLIALAVGVNWRTSEPQSLTAELWAAVPETAAPAPVMPPGPPTPPPPKPVEKVVEPPPQPAKPEPPPPRETDIALEKEKEKQRLKALAEEEKEKAEALKKKKELAAKQKEEEAQRQAQAEAAQREANLKRLQGLAGATGAPTATRTGQRDAGPKGPSAGYGDRIRSRVKPNIVMTEAVEGSPRALVEVRASPDGTILSRRLVKSSGNTSWDEAVLRAIDRTGVLPRDTDGTVPSPIEIGFTPN